MPVRVEVVVSVGSCHYQRSISSRSFFIVCTMVVPSRCAACDSQLDVWMSLELERRDYMSDCLPDFVVAVLAHVEERYPDTAYLFGSALFSFVLLLLLLLLLSLSFR